MTLRLQPAVGSIDGVNTSFQTVFDYIGGSVRAFTPTLQKEVLVVELGGKDFELAEAPLEGDMVLVMYNSV